MHIDAKTLLRRQAYIGGAWRDAGSGKTFDVTNPATGEVIAKVADCDAKDAQAAIDAAEKAFPAWAAKTAKERGAILRRWFDLLMANQDSLGALLTAEQGKPLAEAKGEIAYGSSFIDWFAEEGKRLYGDIIPTYAAGKRVLVYKQPIGVCASITPWNFPNAMIARKLAPALAAGCTIVARPAELTPLSALAMAELAHRAGLPEGVLNIVPGTDAAGIGKLFCESPQIRKVSFTGSTQVGRLLLKQSADTIKKCSMELGGNAPFIVFDDADLDAAVKGAIASKYRNAGQTCVCANRILVQDGIHDAFAEKFTEAVKKLKVGNGMEEGVFVGPLIEPKAIKKVEDHVKDALDKGAKLMTGGKPHKLGGTFYEPTVLADAKPDMKIFREETFGPVAPLFRFKTEEEAIKLANDTEFGLAAYFYTKDMGRVFRVSEALDYGLVGVNEGVISTEVAPFGGVKQSGLGREGSKYGIEDYLEIKYVCVGGI